jgi:hypothetical protein
MLSRIATIRLDRIGHPGTRDRWWPQPIGASALSGWRRTREYENRPTGAASVRKDYFRFRSDLAWTQFTPTMPAQETATPMMLGSTSLALIAVIGIPITIETIASAN